MLNIPQSTAFLCVFKAYLASDHTTEATGKTIAITISKNGGAFGNPNAGALNATEISSGWYKVALDTTDTGTLGPIAIRGAVATIDDFGICHQVVKATNGGMTALPDAAAEAAGGLYTRGSGAGQIAQQANGQIDANLSTIKTQTVTCAAGVTVLASVGTAATSTAQTGDNFARIGAPAGASVSADILTANNKVSGLTFTSANKVDANILAINGDATSAANIAKTTRAIGRGTATTAGSSTTLIATSAFLPVGVAANTDQFAGRVITFDADTTTTKLRGQSTIISSSSAAAAPVFTVTAITIAPVDGDTFSVT